MFTVILIMLGGMAFGYVLRRRNPGKAAGRATTVLIWALLLMLGVEVGGDNRIMSSLGTLGVDALILSVAGIVGSVAAAWVLWRWIVAKKEDIADEG